MDTPRPVLKKRITISRWGPALSAAEKAENIDKAQPALPNGTGSDSKDAEEKIIRIVKVAKEPDNEEKPTEDLNSSQKSSDEEQNSSETSDFLGFSDCGPEKQHSFLKVLDNIEQNKKEEGIEEKESTEHQGLDSINADIEKEKMTVDTRPEEEDESNDSLDKSNSDEKEIDMNKESEVTENDNSSINTTETVQQKPNEKAAESVQDEENQENFKNEDDSEFTIKEEVLSLNDDEGKDDLEDKPNETFSGSENDGSISGNRNGSPLIDALNRQGLEDVSQPVNDRQTMETPEPTILNGSPAQSSGKKKGRTRESIKAKKPPVDVSHPAFLKPFDFGWKRELVYRSTNDTQNRRQSDIYYYTPKGKKVRSFREVLEHLVGQDLTIDNFTFFKEPLGVDDPEKEIIRDAKLKMKDPTVDTPSPILKKSLLPKTPKTPKTTPVPPQETSSDNTPSTPSTPSTPKAGTPRVVFRGGKSKLANFGSKEKFTATQSKNSVPGQANKIIISKVGKRSRKKSDEELEMGMLPPLWQPNEKVAKTREKDTTIVKKKLKNR